VTPFSVVAFTGQFYDFIYKNMKSFNNSSLLRPSKSSGKYMYHVLYESVGITLHFVFMGFMWFCVLTGIGSLNSINQLISVIVKCGVLFEVRTDFLSVI
jgi:hypothetical protein